MRANEYQTRAMSTRLPSCENATYMLFGLMAEVGEIADKIASNKAYDAKLTTDPQSNEGLDELFKRGKELEAARDLAMAQDPYFDYGQACLQIAIVLASIAIISGGSFLLALSGLLGALGVAMTLNGFTMLIHLPGLG